MYPREKKSLKLNGKTNCRKLQSLAQEMPVELILPVPGNVLPAVKSTTVTNPVLSLKVYARWGEKRKRKQRRRNRKIA